MRLRRVAAALLALLAVTAGSAYTVGMVGPPTVTGVDNRFVGVEDGDTTIRTNVTVHNPNPVGFGLDDVVVSYAVRMANVTMATGGERGLSIPTGNRTLSYNTTMGNDRISEWWVRHVRNDERSNLDVTVDLESNDFDGSVRATPTERPVETDVLAALNDTETREVHADFPLVADPILYVNETAGWWGPVTANESPIETRVTVYNPKPIAFAVTSIGYEVTMNDVRVGEGRTDRRYVLEPESATTVNATTVIEHDKLDEWWVTHVENGEETALEIQYYAVVELPTGTEVRLPLEELTHTTTFETDIFRNGPN